MNILWFMYISECSFGSYGDECFYDCGNCYNVTEEVSCNLTTGKCDVSCAPGYIEDSKDRDSQTQCRTGTFIYLFIYLFIYSFD